MIMALSGVEKVKIRLQWPASSRVILLDQHWGTLQIIPHQLLQQQLRTQLQSRYRALIPLTSFVFFPHKANSVPTLPLICYFSQATSFCRHGSFYHYLGYDPPCSRRRPLESRRRYSIWLSVTFKSSTKIFCNVYYSPNNVPLICFLIMYLKR